MPDDPSRTAFHWRRGWLVRSIALTGLVAAACGYGAWGSLSDIWRGHHDAGDIGFVALCAASSLLMASACVTFVHGLLTRPEVLVIDRQGVRDLRLSHEQIPWPGIRSVILTADNSQLLAALDLGEPKSIPLARNPLWALNRLSSRVLGRLEFTLRLQGLDGDLAAVTKALGRVAPPNLGAPPGELHGL